MNTLEKQFPPHASSVTKRCLARTGSGVRSQLSRDYHPRKSSRHTVKLLQGFRGLHGSKAAPAVDRAAVPTAHSLPSWAEGFVTSEEAAQYAPSQLEFLARKRGASPTRAAGTAASPQPQVAAAAAPAARNGLAADSSSSGGNWVDAFVTPEERAKFGQTHLEFLARLRGGNPGNGAVAARPTQEPTSAAAPAVLPPGPSSAPSRPSSAPPRPSSALPRPSSAPPRPSSAPPRPSSAPPRPSSAPPRPSSAPPRPSSAPPRPSSAPPRPSSAPPRPSSALPRPSLAPPRPSSAPPRPSSAPPRPSSAPPRPSSAPPRPSSAPPRPSSAPPRPSSAPPRPSSAPPRARPVSPEAAPYSPAVSSTRSSGSSSSSSSAASWVSSFVSSEEAAQLSPVQLEFLAHRRKEAGSGAAAPRSPPPQQLQQPQARPTSPAGVGRRPSSSPRATKYTAAPADSPPGQPRPELYSDTRGSPPPQQAPARAGSSRPPVMRQPARRPPSGRPQAGTTSSSQQRPPSPAAPASPSPPGVSSVTPLHKELGALVERLGLRSPQPAAPKEGRSGSGNGKLPGWVADFTTAEEAASLAPVQLEFVARKRRAAQGLGPIMPERSLCTACGGKGQCHCRQCQGTGVNQREGHEIMRMGLIKENNGMSSSEWFFRKGGPCWLCRGGKEMACPECKGTGFQGGMEDFTGD